MINLKNWWRGQWRKPKLSEQVEAPMSPVDDNPKITWVRSARKTINVYETLQRKKYTWHIKNKKGEAACRNRTPVCDVTSETVPKEDRTCGACLQWRMPKQSESQATR